jgi:hypothetical protein
VRFGGTIPPVTILCGIGSNVLTDSTVLGAHTDLDITSTSTTVPVTNVLVGGMCMMIKRENFRSST